jgi:hypothetical protein
VADKEAARVLAAEARHLEEEAAQCLRDLNDRASSEPTEALPKKKVKFPDFDKDMPPANVLMDHPATFALNKLKSFE